MGHQQDGHRKHLKIPMIATLYHWNQQMFSTGMLVEEVNMLFSMGIDILARRHDQLKVGKPEKLQAMNEKVKF